MKTNTKIAVILGLLTAVVATATPTVIGHMLRLERATSFATPSSVNKGSLIYNDTKGRPMWSDQSNWVDVPPTFGATVSIDLPALAGTTCNADVDSGLTTLSPNSSCAPGLPPSGGPAGLQASCYVAADTKVMLRLCCVIAAGCADPAAEMYNVRIWTP